MLSDQLASTSVSEDDSIASWTVATVTRIRLKKPNKCKSQLGSLFSPVIMSLDLPLIATKTNLTDFVS